MAKKKATRKPATANAVPSGYKQIGGGYADSWNPEEMPVLEGKVTGEVKTVEMTIGRKKTERRCLEFTTNDDLAVTIWESAALGHFFDHVQNEGIGGQYFIRYDGLGKAKKGQNPPKLFTVAAAA
jgi:hypothetical protein